MKPFRAHPKAIRNVAALTLALILAASGAAALLVRNLHAVAITDAKSQADRFVAGARTAANRSLLGVDVFLAGLNKMLMQQSGLPSFHALIRGTARQNLLLRRVWVLDSQGQVVASSEPAGADEKPEVPPDFFDQAFTPPVSTLTISAPVLSRRSSGRMLLFGRHFSLADGRKLLTVAEVPVDLINTILVQGADIHQLETTLERSNGQLLASTPTLEALNGMTLQPLLATVTNRQVEAMPSRIRHKPALVAARPLLYNGLLITASIPMDTVLDNWQVQTRFIVLIDLVFCLLLGAAGYAIVRHLQSMQGAQRLIADAKATTDRALESMESGFLLLDAQRRVVTWNARYLDVYPGRPEDVQVGVPFEQLLRISAAQTLPGASDEARQQWVDQRLSNMKADQYNHEVQLADGRIIEISERATPDQEWVIVYQDVTRLRRATEEIEQLAFYDSLTGLPNRRLLTSRLQQAVTNMARLGQHGALLFLDLDDFKTLNDTLGHDVGDLLLQEAARRIQACVSDTDTVARLGGDEFVVMLLNLSPDTAEATRQTRELGEQLRQVMNQPFSLREKPYQSSASLGATLFGDGRKNAAELLKQADIAMYQVKKTGRNGLCFFDADMLAAIEARADLENDLRLGLQAGQFELYYQIQVTDKGTPAGAEALLRWHHPTRGLVMPGTFIGTAEATNLIVPLGRWVLEQACRQLRAWQEDVSTAHLQLSVNVSARQFRQADFVSHVRDTLQASGATADLLKLELTESLVLDNVEDTIGKMRELKAVGVRFSIDDFGTGHSSLTYLTRLPLDQLKIDRSFVSNIGLQVNDTVIIQTIIGMGNNLGLEVLAEGVETEAQRDFLIAHGCRLSQGFLFGRPVPIKDFMAGLQT
ncbi:MAG: EAL domain-containing protein [Curvibacter sp.]|nr:MAG: EAL domain-containing protein [Curvibacter sp.]